MQAVIIDINTEAAFESTGLFPRNPLKVLENPTIIDDTENPLFPDGKTTKRFSLASKIITSDDVYNLLKEKKAKE